MTTVMEVQEARPDVNDLGRLTFLRPTTQDTKAVLEMLGRCSRASLFRRFHGFSDGAAHFEALLSDRPADQTLLAWHRSTCVGVATLGVGDQGRSDLGVLIEDAWQRRGVGTRLIASLLTTARAKGVTTVHADILGDDMFVLEALRRIGPVTVSTEFGIHSIEIDIRRQERRPSLRAFPVMRESADSHSGLDQALVGARDRHQGFPS